MRCTVLSALFATHTWSVVAADRGGLDANGDLHHDPVGRRVDPGDHALVGPGDPDVVARDGN